MKLQLEGKNALVTASSYGLGYSIAESLLKEGCNVIVSARDEVKLAKSVAKLSKSGRVIGHKCDLTNDQDLDRLVDFAKTTFDSIDILINNTGHPPTMPLLEATDQDWARGIDLILKPSLKLSKSFLPSMKENKFGRIIFIGSVFGLEAEPSSIIQSTLRTGLNGLMKAIATENAHHSITSNLIAPGYFDTPLVHSLAQDYATRLSKPVETVLEEWKNFSPTKQFGDPKDLGDLVAFLSSQKGKFINGTCLKTDGGALKGY